MNRNHWIDNCPTCGERLWQFYAKKAFIPEDNARDGWSGVEGYFCAGCDKLLIAVGFDSADRTTFWIERDSSGEFKIPLAPAGRSHACYISQAINSAAVISASQFQTLRAIHKEIGPRHKPDDPRLTVAISGRRPEIAAITETLGQWLGNSQSGQLVSTESDSDISLLHIELSELVRAKHQVDRLIRKFDLAGSVTIYGYNEGRRYRI